MTNFIVLEIQHYKDGTTGIVPPVGFEDRNQAEAKYHTVLAAAAVSGVFEHCCAMLDRQGRTIKSESFAHGQSEFPDNMETQETQE